MRRHVALGAGALAMGAVAWWLLAQRHAVDAMQNHGVPSAASGLAASANNAGARLPAAKARSASAAPTAVHDAASGAAMAMPSASPPPALAARPLPQLLDLLACNDTALAAWRIEAGESVGQWLERRRDHASAQERAALTKALEHVAARKAEAQQRLDACAALPEEDRRNALAALESAAQAGVPGARVAYARHALEEFDTPQQVIDRLDEALRRRDLARAFLDAAQARCEPEVWAARFDLRDSALAQQHDAATQAAVAQAYYRAELARGEDASHLQHVRDTLDAAANGLDAAARAQALRQGDAAFARCANAYPAGFP